MGWRQSTSQKEKGQKVMCLNTAIKSAEIMGVLRKVASQGLKNTKKLNTPTQSSQSASKKQTEIPKQKRRIRHTRQMRSNAGRRSFLEGGS